MDLFKLVGSIFIKSDEANEEIDKIKNKAKQVATTVGKSMQDVGSKMTSVGTKMLPVTVAIAGIGTASVKASAEVKAMNSQFEQTFGELQGQASEAMKAVATESGILQTRLQGVGTSIYAFAKSSGADSAEAMSLMETALRATADASAYYDRSLEETSESLMSFLKGNFANDAQLGVSCTETTRNAKAMELFGQKYNDLSEIQKQQTLLKMVTDSQKLSGAMGQASREADGFENVTGNLNESVKILSAELGEVILPTVVNLIQKATGLIQKFSEMDDGTKKLIVTMGLVVGAIAPILIVGGKVIGGIGTIITNIPTIVSGIKTVGTGLKALWGILSANPIGVVITIIGALIAVFIHLWNTSDEFREFLIGLWENIKNVCSVAIEAIKGFFTKIINFVKGNWQGLLLLLVNPFVGAFKLIYDDCEQVRNTVDRIFTKISNSIGDKLNSAKEKVRQAIDKIKGFFKFEWSLPKLKLPHIKISGKFSLSPPSTPKFAIEWYRKAMDEPYMFTKPTVFDFNPLTGTAKGAGEAGDEVMIGKNTMLNMIGQAVAQQNERLISALQESIDRLGDMVKMNGDGEIVIPIYFGNKLIDELVIDAKKRINMRSGGMVSV